MKRNLVIVISLCVGVLFVSLWVTTHLFSKGNEECTLCMPQYNCIEKMEARCLEMEGEWWHSGWFIEGSWCVSWGICSLDFRSRCTTIDTHDGRMIYTWKSVNCVDWACEECEVH
jgi:hypothetical protein